MYSASQYRSDLKRAWKPVAHAGRAFLKPLRTLDPFIYAQPCFRMVAWFVAFLFIATFLAARRLTNI